MAYSSGEVVPTPGAAKPFKVVFRVGDTMISEWPVASLREGEEQIREVLRRLQDVARKQGYII